MMTVRDRLWAKVPHRPEDGCWLIGDGTDYGRIKVAGRTERAHRLAYELTYGRIPDGLVVRHKCDTPACVRPDHLELGTPTDNSNDRTARGRVPYGASLPHTKLTEEDVRTIRRAPSSVTTVSLARQFGVSPQTAWSVRKSLTWKHVA